MRDSQSARNQPMAGRGRAATGAQPSVAAALVLQRTVGNRAVGRLARDPRGRRLLARDVLGTLGNWTAAVTAGVARGAGDVIFGLTDMDPEAIGQRSGDDLIESLTRAQGDPVKTALFHWYRTAGGRPYTLTRAQVIESYRHHSYLNLFAERSPLRRVASELIAQLGSSRTGSATREISAATIGGQGNDALGVHSVEVNGTLSATTHEQRVAVSFSGRLTAHDWWDFDTRLGEMAAGTSRRTWGAEAAVGVIHDVVLGQPFAVDSEAVGVQQDMADDTASITQ